MGNFLIHFFTAFCVIIDLGQVGYIKNNLIFWVPVRYCEIRWYLLQFHEFYVKK